jgi:Flp pilus assembly protein TadD
MLLANASLGLTLYCRTRVAGPDGAIMTCSIYSKAFASVRQFAPVALAAALAFALIGCKTTQPTETTLGGIGVRKEADWPRTAQARAVRYRANPNDPEAAVNYAGALRANGQRAQAVAVLEQASIQHPKHRGVLGAYGRALAYVGNYKQALEVLNHAHTPGAPDWRILSVQGAALDQMGRHEEAQRYYATALRIVPDEPSVLSNLGLSYALSKDLVRAEATLRRAAGQSQVDPQVRQSLALVVGLQRRLAGAEGIARADRPPDQASGDVAYLRQTLAQQNGWQPTQPEKPAVRSEGS